MNFDGTKCGGFYPGRRTTCEDMSNTSPDYVTDEYAEKLDRFAENRDVSRQSAELAFRQYCEELQGSLKDGTPEGALRRIAFHRLERATEYPTPRSNVETDRALQG